MTPTKEQMKLFYAQTAERCLQAYSQLDEKEWEKKASDHWTAKQHLAHTLGTLEEAIRVLEPGNRVGNRTRIHTHCFLEHVTLGARVFLGPGVVFTDDPHPMCPRYEDCVLGATVEDDVSIGGGAVILPGVRIGAGSLVGAGSVVTRDVEPGSVVAGNPARRVKAVDELVCFKGFFSRPYVWRT